MDNLFFPRPLVGRWDKLGGFDVFQKKLNASLAVDADPLESIWIYMINLFEQFGLPMWIGSIPWALLFGWAGYHWSLRLVLRVRAHCEQRRVTRINSSKET